MPTIAEQLSIPDHRLAAMLQLQLLMSQGYFYWNSGVVTATKAASLAEKFTGLYDGILATPNQRSTRRRKHIANVELIFFPDELSDLHLRWFLLATPGKIAPSTRPKDEQFTDLIHQREKMKNGLNIPLEWSGHYILHRRTIKHPLEKKRASRQRWTWSIHPTQTQHWRNRIQLAAEYDARSVISVFDQLRLSPMFAGIRADIRAFDDHAHTIWKKNHRSLGYPSPLTIPLPYTRRVPIYRARRTVASVTAELLAPRPD